MLSENSIVMRFLNFPCTGRNFMHAVLERIDFTTKKIGKKS